MSTAPSSSEAQSSSAWRATNRMGADALEMLLVRLENFRLRETPLHRHSASVGIHTYYPPFNDLLSRYSPMMMFYDPPYPDCYFGM